jgi:hypothetical protein
MRSSIVALNDARIEAHALAVRAPLVEHDAFEARDRVLRGPLREELLGNVGGARGFFVAAHPNVLNSSSVGPEPCARASGGLRHRVETASRSFPSTTRPSMP